MLLVYGSQQAHQEAVLQTPIITQVPRTAMNTPTQQTGSKIRKCQIVLTIVASILIKTAWDSSLVLVNTASPTKFQIFTAITCWIVGLCCLFFAVADS